MLSKKRGLKLFKKGKDKDRFYLLKRLISLAANRAGRKQYFLEIGAYYLRKGAGFEVGQVIKEKQIEPGRWKVKVITGLFFDFKDNRINHTCENKVIKY